MKVMSKFIIDRNETEYYYVEKIKDSDGIKYLVYMKNRKVVVFNQHNFHNIYGMDEQLSVSKFACQASLRLIEGYNYDVVQKEGYNRLQKVLSNILQDRNLKNPSLGLFKNDLLESIDAYNATLSNYDDENSFYIPYIENYELIMKNKESARQPYSNAKTNTLNGEKIHESLNLAEPSVGSREGYVRDRKYDI